MRRVATTRERRLAENRMMVTLVRGAVQLVGSKRAVATRERWPAEDRDREFGGDSRTAESQARL